MMQELTAPTGGRFIQNINDLAGALHRPNSPSGYICLPGFTPEKLKFDESFHALKVELSKNENLTLQAAFAIMPQALATASFSTFFCCGESRIVEQGPLIYTASQLGRPFPCRLP